MDASVPSVEGRPSRATSASEVMTTDIAVTESEPYFCDSGLLATA